MDYSVKIEAEIKSETINTKENVVLSGTIMAFIGSIEFFTPGEDFTDYRERLEHLLSINKITDDKTKVSYLITLIGPETYKILKSLTNPDKPDTKKDLNLIKEIKKFMSVLVTMFLI